VQVSKWGNSLAVRLPAAVVEALGLKAGDEIRLRAVKATDSEFLLAVPLTREEAVEGLRQLRWKLPSGYKFNREELYERKRQRG
jgi:antitoxin MazE